MSGITLHMRPEREPVGWEEFCATHSPYAIALDGYVAASSRFDPSGPRLNLDHHADVDRLTARATCAQTLLALRQGLLERFRDENGPRVDVYVNDCDEDVCTAWFLLTHANLAAGGRQPRLDQLVNLVDVLDTTAGACPLPPDLTVLKELAWVFAPYHHFRRSGALDRREPHAHHDVVAEVCNRMERHVDGGGSTCRLDGRYQRCGGGPGWVLLKELGAQARIAAAADGIRAYVAVRDRSDGRWAYTVGRKSPFVPFDVPAILRVLNEAEEPGGGRWGGSNIVGGSPRVRGSMLCPADVERIINRLMQTSRKHSPPKVTAPRGLGAVRPALVDR